MADAFSTALAAALAPPGERPLRVLIVRIGAMGDVLHGMPAVAGLRVALPGCFIGWAIEPRWTPLLQSESGALPLVDQLHPVRTREWKQRMFSPATVREITALRQELQAAHYDVCIDLQGSIRSSIIARMAGARRLTGHAAPREWPARWLYQQRVQPSAPNVIGQACELVGAGVGQELRAARPPLPTATATEAWCDEMIATPSGKPAGAPIVLFATTAGWKAKEWGIDRYRALAQALLGAGCRVLVNAAPGSGPAPADLPGTEAVSSTLAQLIALTRRASLVIGGDTGPVHLAAALGRPVVAIFGPTDPMRNGPYFPGARLTVLRHASSVTSHKRHNETESGLKRIRVEEVLAAALALLNQPQER